jgi:hypothetical protein
MRTRIRTRTRRHVRRLCQPWPSSIMARPADAYSGGMTATATAPSQAGRAPVRGHGTSTATQAIAPTQTTRERRRQGRCRTRRPSAEQGAQRSRAWSQGSPRTPAADRGISSQPCCWQSRLRCGRCEKKQWDRHWVDGGCGRAPTEALPREDVGQIGLGAAVKADVNVAAGEPRARATGTRTRCLRRQPKATDNLQRNQAPQGSAQHGQRQGQQCTGPGRRRPNGWGPKQSVRKLRKKRATAPR